MGAVYVTVLFFDHTRAPHHTGGDWEPLCRRQARNWQSIVSIINLLIFNNYHFLTLCNLPLSINSLNYITVYGSAMSLPLRTTTLPCPRVNAKLLRRRLLRWFRTTASLLLAVCLSFRLSLSQCDRLYERKTQIRASDYA